MHATGFWGGYAIGIAAALLWSVSAGASNALWVVAMILLGWQLRSAFHRHRHDHSMEADIHLWISIVFFLAFFAIQVVLNVFF